MEMFFNSPLKLEIYSAKTQFLLFEVYWFRPGIAVYMLGLSHAHYRLVIIKIFIYQYLAHFIK